jgi:predicted GTPase
MDMIRDIANDKISRMALSESANDWIAWSQELEKFTNCGNAANNDNIKNPDLKNKLDELYREVVNVGLNNKLKSSVENLTPAEKSSLMNNEQVTTVDGIRIKTSRNGGHQDASLRYLDYEP